MFTAMSDEPQGDEECAPDATVQADISVHIFSVSAAMVGVCLTVIGLFRAAVRLGASATIGDNLLAVDALIFLFSCVSSYGALRTRRSLSRRRLERIADALFLTALLLMVIVTAFVAYELI